MALFRRKWLFPGLMALALLMGLAALCAADEAGRAGAAAEAEAVVVRLYQRYDAAGRRLTRELREGYLSPGLLQAIEKDEAGVDDGEEGLLDFSPLYDAQDLEIRNFAVGPARVTEKAAEVPVSFENAGRKVRLTCLLENGADGWRLADVVYADRRRLLAILQREMPNLRQEIPADILGSWDVVSFYFAGISAFSEQEAQAWVGKSLVIDKICVSLAGRKLAAAAVQSREVSASDYFRDFKTTPAAVGWQTDKVHEYTVFEDAGGTLLLVGPEQVMTVWNGVFFRLVRLPLAEVQAIRNPRFLGRWQALSRSSQAIAGDLEVAEAQLAFARKGRVAFQVLRCDGQEYLLKTSRVVDSGRYLRLGPLRSEGRDDEIEVAYYDSLEKALAPRQDRIGQASSWGVYVREPPAPVLPADPTTPVLPAN